MLLDELALTESINDKGLYKAVFFAGVPGAGKSYVAKHITDGAVQPRIINTDSYIEFVGRMKGVDISDKETQRGHLDTAKQVTRKFLIQAINGMLPLYIDGTSSNAPNIMRRKGILEGFGYDVAMVWIDTPLETSMERAEQRERAVNPEFIRQVYERTSANKPFYQNKFQHFTTVKNGEGELDDDAILAAYKKVSRFFHASLDNPIGIRNLEKMRENNYKYLAPNVYSIDELTNLINGWYVRA